MEKPWGLLDESASSANVKIMENIKDHQSDSKPDIGGDVSSEGGSIVGSSGDKNDETHVPTEDKDIGVFKSDDDKSQEKDKIKTPPKAGRNNLIPSYVKLSFKGHKKCSRIFNELKTHLTFDKTPNSISILLRVFIDLSVSSFIEDNNIDKKDLNRNPGLHDKVILCAHYFLDKKKMSGSQCTAIITYSSQITKHSGSLQQYVHNPHLLLSKEAVNTEWDNFEKLLSLIWSD